MTAVAASETAMTAIIASDTALDSVVASDTAMTAVAASETAMTAIIASDTAKLAIWNSTEAINAMNNHLTVDVLTAIENHPYIVTRTDFPSNLTNKIITGKSILLGVECSSSNGDSISLINKAGGSGSGVLQENHISEGSNLYIRVVAFNDIRFYSYYNNYQTTLYILKVG